MCDFYSRNKSVLPKRQHVVHCLQYCGDVREVHCYVHFPVFGKAYQLSVHCRISPFPDICSPDIKSGTNSFNFEAVRLPLSRCLCDSLMAEHCNSCCCNSIKVRGLVIKCQTVVLWKHQQCHSVRIYASTHSHL